MKILIIATMVAVCTAKSICAEPESRTEQAAKQSSDIIVARILESSPVAHGANGATVSFKVQLIRHLKGNNTFLARWINYSVLKDQKSFGTDYESSLKKNDERIFFITNDQLLRAESIDRESKVKSIIKEVQQAAPRNR